MRRGRGPGAGAWSAAARQRPACRVAAGQMLVALLQDAAVVAVLHTSIALQEPLDQVRTPPPFHHPPTPSLDHCGWSATYAQSYHPALTLGRSLVKRGSSLAFSPAVLEMGAGWAAEDRFA